MNNDKEKVNSNLSDSTKKTALNSLQSGFTVFKEKTAHEIAHDFKAKRKRFMNRLPYKNINIIRSKNGDWRVTYEYEYPDKPGEFKKFYVRDGINYVKGLEQREIEAKKLKKDIELALKSGFNPFKPKIRIESQLFAEETTIKVEKSINKIDPWTLNQAEIQFLKYCKKKGLTANSIKKYESSLRVLLRWFAENNIQDIEVSNIHEDHINDFLDESFEDFGWSNRTYNNYLNFCSTFFSRVEKLEKRRNKEIKYLIDFDFLEEKFNRAEKNKYYTPQVAELVKKKLKKNIELYRYVRWIFYSCMRPIEIHDLQIENVDIENRQIKVDGKTGYRFVPICDELLALIHEMKLSENPINYYVFGKGGKPSPHRVYDDYFRGRYRPIKQSLNLDKNYTLYSWKHTRVISLISAGFDDNQVMTLTGHRDRAGFEAYKRDLIIDNTVMKGKTIEF